MNKTGAQTVLLCAFAGVWAFWALPVSLYDNIGEAKPAQYADAGEALLHGAERVEGSVSYNRPMESVLAARLFSHGGARGGVWVKRLSALLALGLMFAAGALLGDARIGAAAAVLLILAAPGGWHYATGYPQNFVVLFALALCCAALLPKTASWRRPAFAVLSAASLWFNPVLAPFAALWTLADCDAPLKRRFLWAAVPWVLLLPWTAANLALGNGLIFFDAGRSQEFFGADPQGAAGFFRSLFSAVEARHFEPLWPISALAAAAWAFRRRRPRKFTPPRWAIFTTTLAAGLAAVLLFDSALTVSLYPSRLKAGFAGGQDAWVLARRAQMSLDAGDSSSALADLEKALELKPGERALLVERAWAKALAGSPEELFLLEIPRELDEPALSFRLKALKAAAAFAGKTPGGGRDRLREAENYWRSEYGPGSEERMRGHLRGLRRAPLGAAERMELLAALIENGDDDRGLKLDFLGAALSAGSGAGARRALGGLGELSPEEAHWAASHAPEAFRAEGLRLLLERCRSNSALWLKLAEAEHARGKKSAAWDALESGAKVGSEAMRRLAAAARFMERRGHD